jgi:cellobiose-specific phosphotransferase system component IIC
MDKFVNQAPLALIGGALFLLLIGLREGSAWLTRRWASDRGTDHPGYVLSGVLGLLSLLIAFTFGLALDRYEARYNLLVAEAAALNTADMRVRLLDQPASGRLVKLVREYAEVRVRYGSADAGEKPPFEAASQTLRREIQRETLSAVRNVRDRPFAPLVIQAVNDALAVGVSREAAHNAPLPTTIILVLIVYALVVAAVMGYTLPSRGHQHRIVSGMLFLLLTLAMSLILDLDRARSGTIQIDQGPMERLVERLDDTAPPPANARIGVTP